MDIYVINTDFQIVGIIDEYSSLIWTTRYFTHGDFELYLPASEKAIDLLQENYYLCRAQDITQDGGKSTYKNVMIIETIQVQTDVEASNHLIITGRCLKSILKRRIVWQQTNLNGKVELSIRRLVMENVINPTIAARKISNLVLGDVAGLSETTEMQVTGDNLGETIDKMCTTYGYGYDIIVVNGNFVFYLYEGVDRSYNQTKNPYVVFSNQFENLLKTDYSFDTQNYKNVALVAGEGEGLERKTQAIGTATGLMRYETYVDARDLSTNEGEYTEAEYNNMMTTRGQESLAESPVVESFSGETETRLTYTLNKDYFLGDIVQVQNEYGISATPRILEIIESDDENGSSIIPTFSTLEV